MKNIEDIIDRYLGKVIGIRRTIHENPELALQEFNTSKIVYDTLKVLDVDIKTKVGKTGIVANLNPNTTKKTIMLRADMDALPIDEHTNLKFKSKVKNVMHACGHDVHTSILLGTAIVLNELKDKIDGNVKFVFQPAEENNPSGGAPLMIKEGVLENPKVNNAIALHVKDLPLGSVGIKTGPITSESDRIFIKVIGKNSHGSAPHMGKDAIVTSAHIITALQTIVSRDISPVETAVITISTIHGGRRYNVLADEVNMEGTVRCFNNDIAKFLPHRIEEIVTSICTTFDCDCEFKYQYGYPVTRNDEDFTEEVIKSLEKSLGEYNVINMPYCNTGAEDFAFFSREVPSTLFYLGCKSEINKDCCVIHNPDFICDENCIRYGIKALVNIVLDYFKA